MIAAGIILFLILPRDPWPAALFAHLAGSALTGSCLARRLLRGTGAGAGAFLLAWALGTIVFVAGGTIWEIAAGEPTTLSYYRQLWFMVALFASLYAFAATLCAFPLVAMVADVWRGWELR
jgi:hypothetical protein